MKINLLTKFKKFRRGIKDFIIKQYFNFIYFYGTRPGEAMALRFCDIKGKYVYIQHSIERHGKRSLNTPKNQSSIRTIKINLLTRFRIWLLKKKYNNFQITYFVFGGEKPLSPSTIDRRKLEACNKMKIRPITQHQFRHSYATRMIHKKVPIDYVSRSMGHSQVSMTLDVYLHKEKERSPRSKTWL